MDRTERINLIHENLRLAKENEKIGDFVKKSISNQQIFWENDVLLVPEESYDKPTNLYVSQQRSIEAAMKYNGKRICVLNFASSLTPGGGVLRGDSAQEESICRVTSLYSSISDNSVSDFYQKHRKQFFEEENCRRNTDDCIYSPYILCYREDTMDCTMLPEDIWCEISVITCAAPDQRNFYGEDGKNQPDDIEQLRDFEKRIHRILTIAAMNKTEVLILGAFGCGVFGNSPWIVAKAFKNQINQFRYHFETIEFAIYSKNEFDENYRAFSSIINNEDI